MIIRATTDFYDLKENCGRKRDDEFEVSEERGRQIISAGYAVELPQAVSDAPVSVPSAEMDKSTTPKAKRARKAKETA